MIGDIRSKLITLISTDAIKAYLDTFTIGANEHYAIFVGKMIPDRVSPQGSGDIRPLNYTVNCRQSTELNSIALADLVYDVLNRTFHTITDGDMYMQAVIQPTIYEDENCWNCPVEINVRNNL